MIDVRSVEGAGAGAGGIRGGGGSADAYGGSALPPGLAAPRAVTWVSILVEREGEARRRRGRGGRRDLVGLNVNT